MWVRGDRAEKDVDETLHYSQCHDLGNARQEKATYRLKQDKKATKYRCKQDKKATNYRFKQDKEATKYTG